MYGRVEGRCPSGGLHDFSGSIDYFLGVDTPGAYGYSDWRCCQNCQVLFWGGDGFSGLCPSGGGAHEPETMDLPHRTRVVINDYYLVPDRDDPRSFLIPPPGQDREHADWQVGQKFLDRKRNISISIDDIDSGISIGTVTVGTV